MGTDTLERARTNGGGVAFAGGATVNSPHNGRLVSTGHLTDQQEAFCNIYVENGADGSHAAKLAGYVSDHADIAKRNLKLSKIRARIQEIAHMRVETACGVVGLSVMLEIAQDKGAPPGVRAKLAIRLAEGAGLFSDRPADSANPRKSLAEMTREELEAVVAQGAAVLQAASKIGPVLTARVAPDNAQVTDATALKPIPDKA